MTGEDALLAAELGGDAPELDLHGLDRGEAADALEHFLQSSFMRDDRAVRIVCGRGTGALVEDVLAALAGHRLIETVRPSPNPREIGAVVYAALIPRK